MTYGLRRYLMASVSPMAIASALALQAYDAAQVPADGWPPSEDADLEGVDVS